MNQSFQELFEYKQTELKEINDNYGHANDDKYLRLTATVLDGATRQEDIAARISGDEFAILLPETESESAELVIRRIKSR
ncbi:MAG: diguanylate cyclase domain-containing protein, partial [Bacillota bacterium]